MGRTFIVAISLLGLGAVLQLGAVAWAFISKYHSAIEPAPAANVAKSEVPEKLVLVDPFVAPEATATPAPARASTPAATPAAPVENPMAMLPKPTPLEKESTETRLDALIAQARSVRENGDTSTALTLLREALALAPNSALIISELATTFEKMGQDDKALEQWRRIFDMGESAGIYYQAADAKLKASEAATQAMVKHGGSDLSGIQPGSTLGLGEMTIADQTEPGGPKKFMLKIPLKARPNSDIEVKDVVIQVFFYDMLDGANIVQTNANVSSRWITLPADWKDDDIEILEVDYGQPLPKPGKPAENRTYFGYVVRVYYKGELQDWRADQEKLRAQYPPPLTLPTDNPS